MLKNRAWTESKTYDVIIVGAGHAGSEAALAASKSGAYTLLITASLDSIGLIAGDSCFDETVEEGINALVRVGGLLPLALKKSSFGILRAQSFKGEKRYLLVDRRAYHIFCKHYLEKTENLTIKQSIVAAVLKDNEVFLVTTALGECFKGKTVVLSPGFFLGRRLILRGKTKPTGEPRELAGSGLLTSLSQLGFSFKRATEVASPRINAKSIDKKSLEKFAIEISSTEKDTRLVGYLLRLPGKTQKRITESCRTMSFQSSGDSSFSSKRLLVETASERALESLRLIVLPESTNTAELNIMNLKTSLDEAKQRQIVTSLPGLERAMIVRHGCAVEHSVLAPGQVDSHYETKFEGLFAAGGVIDCSDLTEAALQGCVAGLNAFRKTQRQEPAQRKDLIRCFT